VCGRAGELGLQGRGGAAVGAAVCLSAAKKRRRGDAVDAAAYSRGVCGCVAAAAVAAAVGCDFDWCEEGVRVRVRVKGGCRPL
jgi:hypothetical protein